MTIPRNLKSRINQGCFAALATHTNSNDIQNHLMWIDYEDENFLINTEQERKKTENIRLNSTLTLLIFSPKQMYESWEIRGSVVDIKQGGDANKHIDKLSQLYIGKPYKRQEGTSWDEDNIKDREIWIIKPNTIFSMSSLGSQPNSE